MNPVGDIKWIVWGLLLAAMLGGVAFAIRRWKRGIQDAERKRAREKAEKLEGEMLEKIMAPRDRDATRDKLDRGVF